MGKYSTMYNEVNWSKRIYSNGKNTERRTFEMGLSSGLVVALGLGTVFVGLVSIIVLCYIMSAIVKLFEKGKKKEQAAGVQTVNNNAPIANKQELVAISCAVIAEELGTDVKNIKVVSFKRA